MVILFLVYKNFPEISIVVTSYKVAMTDAKCKQVFQTSQLELYESYLSFSFYANFLKIKPHILIAGKHAEKF